MMHLKWAPKCEATPLFLFTINLIGFFHMHCPTLSKINRAVFCQWSLLKMRAKIQKRKISFLEDITHCLRLEYELKLSYWLEILKIGELKIES
jgi:hypothetical protein